MHQWIQDGVDALKEFGRLGPGLAQLFADFKANGKTAIHDIVTLMDGLIKLVDNLGGAYGKASGEVKAMANLTVASFNLVGSSISAALEPMRWLISANNKLNPVLTIPQIPQFTPSQLPSPGAGINPFTPKTQGNAQAAPGTYSGPGSDAAPVPGLSLATGQKPWWPTVPTYPTGGYAVPGVPDDGKGEKDKLPAVPLGNNDPMSLLQGFPATASLYSAAGTVLDNRQKVAQAESDLNALQKSNTATESEIVAKRNELERAKREEHESELRLNEAKAQAVQKSLKGMQSAQGDLQQLGAQLDKDFGISKGLGGIVENAVKAIGNALAAPFLQALGFVAKANPNEGSGLVGIAAANGLFGPEYTPSVIAASQMMQRGNYGIPGGGYGPVAGIPAMPGESARDFAHRAMMPYWASQGLQATDHAADGRGEHQNGALDIPVSSIAQGNQVLQQILRDPNVYGTIFNNQTYGYGHGPTPQDYSGGHTGDPNQDHTNHVHALYKPGGSDNITQGAQQVTTSLTSLAAAANTATQALSSGGGDKGSIAKAIYSSVLGAGYSPATAMAAVQAGLLESGLSTSAQNQGHNSLFQTSADKGVGSDPASQINWLLGEMGRQGGPAVANADPLNFFADRIERGGYPGSNYNQFLPQAQELVGAGGTLPPTPGGGPMYPGIGPSQALPGMSPLGQVSPAVGGGTAYPSQGGNSGNLLGGIPMDGIMAATSGLDAIAPGTSAAAKIGIQVANRTIGYAAQNAGIAANAVGEFFSVGDNPKGSIGAGWLGKLAGGFAGAAPALPNLAAQKAPEQKQGSGQQQGGDAGGGVTNNINVQSRDGASGQEHGEQIAAETSRMYAPAGRQ